MKPEQIGRRERAQGYRKWLKRQAHRLLRRLSRRDPENAPTRAPYFGYSL